MLMTICNTSISDALKTCLITPLLYKLSILSKECEEVYNTTLVDMIIYNLRKSSHDTSTSRIKWFVTSINVLSEKLSQFEDDFNQHNEWSWGRYNTVERVTNTILADMLKSC